MLGAATLALLAGLEIGGKTEDGATSFHDMHVLSTEELTGLVDGGDPAVAALAERLRVPEAGYLYVRDRLAFDPGRPAGAPGETVAQGAASCLGKAALLASLYRAMGIPDAQVRVVTGQVRSPQGLLEHAWVELEHEGRCLQQDPTPLLGIFPFERFRGMEYTQAFVHRELFCFNDRGFAVISQRNRFRADGR